MAQRFLLRKPETSPSPMSLSARPIRRRLPPPAGSRLRFRCLRPSREQCFESLCALVWHSGRCARWRQNSLPGDQPPLLSHQWSNSTWPGRLERDQTTRGAPGGQRVTPKQVLKQRVKSAPFDCRRAALYCASRSDPAPYTLGGPGDQLQQQSEEPMPNIDFSVGIGGAAGQGVATPGNILAKLFARRGLHINASTRTSPSSAAATPSSPSAPARSPSAAWATGWTCSSR